MVTDCNCPVRQSCKILCSTILAQKFAQNLDCFFPMLFPEPLLILLLRGKQDGVWKTHCKSKPPATASKCSCSCSRATLTFFQRKDPSSQLFPNKIHLFCKEHLFSTVRNNAMRCNYVLHVIIIQQLIKPSYCVFHQCILEMFMGIKMVCCGPTSVTKTPDLNAFQSFLQNEKV